MITSLLPTILFFFNDPGTTEIYTLSLHDALPISAKKIFSRLFRRLFRKPSKAPFAKANCIGDLTGFRNPALITPTWNRPQDRMGRLRQAAVQCSGAPLP